MRIVYIHQYYRTPEMAGGTRSHEFARRLVERGHQVSLITADPAFAGAPRSGWRKTTEAGIEVYWVNVRYDNAMPPWRRIVSFLHFMGRAARLAVALPQDLVFATSTPLTVAIPGVWSAYRRRVPFVFEVRDLWPSLPIAMGALRSRPSRTAARLLERWSYARADKIIALSPDMAHGVLAVRPQSDVTVIPNGSDIELFRQVSAADERLAVEHPWTADRPIILYAGTFGRANGVGYLVDVAAELRDTMPEAAVVLVGGGAEFESVRARADNRGVLGKNCFVLDSVTKQEVAAWFRACSVAVSTFVDLPGLQANSPNKVFDALAAGRPVAVNNGGWMADLLEKSGAGIELPPTSPADAAAQLSALLTDPTRLEAASQAARALADTEFSRDILFSRFEKVLTQAVSG